AELEKDYKAMENMIFDKYISFDEIIKTLQELEIEINSL
ncbi:MAG: L-rhamnose isomerase, partial [Clostridium sp.]